MCPLASLVPRYSRVRSLAGGFDQSFPLPKQNWKYLGEPGENKGYRYRSRGSGGAIVNGVRLIRQPITDRDHAGRPLPRLPFGRHVVAPAHVWLVGQSHARSWDSRYFGPVAVAGVRGVARPILTIGEARR